MRTFREIRADRAAWREYRADITAMDRSLAKMEAEGIDPGSPEYDEAWTDRMSYAANRYPGAPALDLSDPAASAAPEPEAEAEI